MDKLAVKELLTTAYRVRLAVVEMGASYTSATRAVDNGGPDFRERIKTLIHSADQLYTDIEEAAGPVEKHPGFPCTDIYCPVHGASARPDAPEGCTRLYEERPSLYKQPGFSLRDDHE